MPADLPLLSVIAAILSHTPLGVWFVLIVITLLGLRQRNPYRVTRRRLVLTSTTLSVLSLAAATSAFGATPAVVLGWLATLMAVVLANQHLRWPGAARCEAPGVFALPGSMAPLLLMWAVFGLRYTVAVALVLHPDWAREPALSVSAAMAYGLLSGVFMARTWRILGTETLPRLQTA
jgi:hypothetical protein